MEFGYHLTAMHQRLNEMKNMAPRGREQRYLHEASLYYFVLFLENSVTTIFWSQCTADQPAVICQHEQSHTIRFCCSRILSKLLDTVISIVDDSDTDVITSRNDGILVKVFSCTAMAFSPDLKLLFAASEMVLNFQKSICILRHIG